MEKEVSGEEFKQMSVSSRNSKNQKNHTLTIPVAWLAIVIVVGVLCFLGGVHYEKNHVSKTKPATPASVGFGGGFGGAERGLRAFGTVSSVSSTSITVSNERTGSSDTYNITSNTKITDNGQVVSYSDIQTGDTVIITKASTTSSNASSILVNPSFGGGGGLGGSSTSPTSGIPSSGTPSSGTSRGSSQ